VTALLPWRIAILVSVAIAISSLDRQTLPVAVHAIGKDIPLSNQQFSALQSAFLFSYALMCAGGGKLADAYSIPVIPHAGQMHNYQAVMASLNSPMAEYCPWLM
jgi:sugar phosphate permease